MLRDDYCSSASQSTLDVLGLRNSLKPSEEVLLRTKSVECNQSSQCFPPDVDNAPTNLIDCDRNQCLCKQCFERGPNGICEESDCEDYYYSNERRECVDHRKSQTTAFLLSFFLSSVGAANFYIEQNAMGKTIQRRQACIGSHRVDCGIPINL